MITLQPPDLHRMIQQVSPHMDDPAHCNPVLSSIRVEARDGWLYAIATDRYTFAVARRKITMTDPDDSPAVGHIPGHLMTAATAWLAGAAESGEPVHLTLPAAPGDPVVLAQGGAQFHTPFDPDNYKSYPDWRNLFRTALTAEPTTIPLTGFTTKLLTRWQHADTKLIAWQPDANLPVLLLSEDGTFAGLHMPVMYVRDGMSRQEAASPWVTVTARTTIDGTEYDLGATWLDRHGDPWTYSGKDTTRLGVPLMVLGDITDDPHPLDRVVREYGPLRQA